VDGGAAQLHHADLEGDARAQARFLEDHGERPSREQRMRLPVAQLGLQAPGEGEDRLDLPGGEVGDAQDVSLHQYSSLTLANIPRSRSRTFVAHARAASARSRIAKPSSTCARVTMSGGR